MMDTLFGLVPDYGVFVIFAVVSVACLAVPLPSSALVLASGGFAAAGDLPVMQVLAVVFAAFVIGDQLAFGIARRFGPRLLGWLRKKKHAGSVLSKGEDLVDRKGVLAVLISHTVLSPTCPYVSYICGAGGMNWALFSVTAAIGAAIWTVGYVALGYVFASQLTQVSDILGQVFGLALGVGVLIWSWRGLKRKWAAL